jgi:hypothetical protein
MDSQAGTLPSDEAAVQKFRGALPPGFDESQILTCT